MPTNLITTDPQILFGKPVIRGTRISVELILEKLAAGETREQILVGHPQLNNAAITAAIEYAMEALRTEKVYPVTTGS